MLTLKTGKGPAHRRNLRTLNYRTAYDMDWLHEYDRRNKEAGDQLHATTDAEELASSSTPLSIDVMCHCDSVTKLGFYNNDSASPRTGIG